MSGSVARNMPGSGCINGNNPKPGTLLTADVVDETQRSLHWMARRTTGTQLNGGERTLRRQIDRKRSKFSEKIHISMQQSSLQKVDLKVSDK